MTGKSKRNYIFIVRHGIHVVNPNGLIFRDVFPTPLNCFIYCPWHVISRRCDFHIASPNTQICCVVIPTPIKILFVFRFTPLLFHSNNTILFLFSFFLSSLTIYLPPLKISKHPTISLLIFLLVPRHFYKAPYLKAQRYILYFILLNFSTILIFILFHIFLVYKYSRSWSRLRLKVCINFYFQKNIYLEYILCVYFCNL